MGGGGALIEKEVKTFVQDFFFFFCASPSVMTLKYLIQILIPSKQAWIKMIKVLV